MLRVTVIFLFLKATDPTVWALFKLLSKLVVILVELRINKVRTESNDGVCSVPRYLGLVGRHDNTLSLVY